MSEQPQSLSGNPEESGGGFSLDVIGMILRFLRYWWLFVICAVIAVAWAYIRNRYTPDVYSATANVQILKNEAQEVDLTILEGGRLGSKSFNYENEAAILNSRRMMEKVVKSLDLNTVYFAEGKVQTVELWKDDLPFELTWLGDETQTFSTPLLLIHFQTSTDITISNREGKNPQNAMVGERINYNGHEFTIDLKQNYSPGQLAGQEYLVRRIPLRSAIGSLRAGINLARYSKGSDIVTVSYTGTSKAKNEAIVDSLISLYNQDGMADRQRVSVGTEKFISDRLNLLHRELDTVESGLVDFMQVEGMVNVESATGRLLTQETEAERRFFETEMQKRLTETFKDGMVTGKDYALLPDNIGIDQGSINSLIARYNEIALERQERLVSSTRENPKVKNLETRLDEVKENMIKSIDGYIRDLDLTLDTFKERESSSASELHYIPEKEKVVRGIMRQQEIKEQLYLFLLQKREEAAMKYAVTSPIIKVVDYAHSSGPIAPNRQMFYILALAIGLALPFGILFLLFMFDNKVRTKQDIESFLPGYPILAEIPETRESKALVGKNDHSNLAEAFRILRTNLMFFKANPNEEGQGRVVYATSTIKGEGKTFVALNVAHTFATTGKKTLIIGADLRNPQTHKYYDLIKDGVGLSNYLSDDSIEFEDLISYRHPEFNNLDLIIAGQIPPNPAELLMDHRFGDLIAEARRRYDYIIVDTAPTMLVSDTLLISKYADAILYLVRANHTRKPVLAHIRETKKAGKLHHIGIVLNAVNEKAGYGYGYGYNYGYGYGYSEDQYIPRWKFWKKR